MAPTNSIEKVVLTIAGSDSGGGAGIQADLKTFEAYRVFGTSAITALTAQNTVGVQGVMGVAPTFVKSQLDSVLEDFQVSAIKTGMLFSAEIIQTVVDRIQGLGIPLVVDPVMVSTSGHVLLQADALARIKNNLLPISTVITPNLAEASLLTGMDIHTRDQMVLAAQQLSNVYPSAWILIKGGHLEGNVAVDLLHNGNETHWMEAPRMATNDTHGTGCTLSSAIAAGLALGWDMKTAVSRGKNYVHGCLQQAWTGLGHGHGSLKHFSTRP